MKKLILILLTLLAINPVLAACPKPKVHSTTKSRATATTTTTTRTQIAAHDDDEEELSIFAQAPKSKSFKRKMESWAAQILIACENFASKFKSR